MDAKTKKTGVFSWCGYFSDFRRRAEYIKEAGFDGLMLWWEDDAGAWPCSKKQMTAIAKELGLEIFNSHIANIHENFIWSENKALREKHLFTIVNTIEEIAAAGIFNLVVHLCESAAVPPPGKALFDSIEFILPYAQENHVTLSLENTWRDDYLTAVWEAFPREGLGFCFDSSHAQLRGHFDLLKDHYDKLTALHLSDNDGEEDRHWLPFDGIVNFEACVAPYLSKTAVPYTLELISDKEKYPDEREYLREARRRLDRLLAMEATF